MKLKYVMFFLGALMTIIASIVMIQNRQKGSVFALTESSGENDAFLPMVITAVEQPGGGPQTPVPATPSPIAPPTSTNTSTPTRTLAPTATNTPVPTDSSPSTQVPPATSTHIPPTPTSTLIPSPTITSTPISTPEGMILIDHTSIALFDHIPVAYIVAARELHSFFKHASVGNNISYGLNCLGENYNFRPPGCDRDLEPDEIFHDSQYDRSNWVFEYHQPLPNQNPGWNNKVFYFVERVNNPETGEDYDVAGFKFGFVDVVDEPNTLIHELYFNNDPNDNWPSVEDIEQLEADNPDKIVVYWTLGLSLGVGTPQSTSFNQQMREYAIENGKVLMDFSDIMSHDPDGNLCTNPFDGSGHESMCPDYTAQTGPGGGHLNARGSLVMAKAYWVLMARLAGWDGVSH